MRLPLSATDARSGPPATALPLADSGEASGWVHALSTRRGGVSGGPFTSLNLGLHVGDREADVIENRRRLCASLGLPFEAMVVGEQVHGTTVAAVGAGDRGRGALAHADALPGVDALVTATPGVPLLVQVADCAPVLLCDPRRPALGVAHAGWRGALGGVAAATVEAMHEAFGCHAADLRVAIGPCIGLDDYEVGDDVASAVEACERAGAHDARRRWLRPVGRRWRLDLRAALVDQLLAAGVRWERIHVDARSTAAHTHDFFSYRAEERTGRFGLVAMLRSPL